MTSRGYPFLSRYWDLLVSIGILWGLYLWWFRSELFWATHVNTGDNIDWYATFHFFLESVKTGVMPFWDPYHHGGTPFAINFGVHRLIDPTTWIFAGIAKVFDPDLLFLFHWFFRSRDLLYFLGVVLLVRYLFRDKRVVCVLAFLFVFIFKFESECNIRHSLYWTPYFALFALRAFKEQSKLYILLSCFVVGWAIGADYYPPAFALTFALIYVVGFCLVAPQKVYAFVGKNIGTLVAGAFLILLSSSPFWIQFLDGDSIFPVNRAFVSRETYISDDGQIGGLTQMPPYEALYFNVTSPFRGYPLTKDLIWRHLFNNRLPFNALILFLMLQGLFSPKLRFRFPLLLATGGTIYIAFATLPGYRWLYEHLPPFNGIRHTVLFLYITELVQIALCGYGLKDFLSDEKTHPRRMILTLCFMGLLYLVFPTLIKIWYLVPCLAAVRYFFRPNERLLPLLALTGLWVATDGQLERLRDFTDTPSRDRWTAVMSLNDTYKPLYENHFRAGPVTYDPERVRTVPRPAHMVFEGMLLKKDIALSTVLVPPKGKPDNQELLRGWKDGVASNRTIVWHRNYVEPYLIGEKNAQAFDDILGVERKKVRFFPDRTVFKVPREEQKKYFENFSTEHFRITDRAIFLEEKGAPPSSLGSLKLISSPFSYRLISFNANQIKLEISTRESGYVLYNDTFDRRWRANLNGEPVGIERANLSFKAVHVPPGSSILEFSYVPPFSYAARIYILIQFAGLGSLLLWVLLKGKNYANVLRAFQMKRYVIINENS